MHLKRCDASPTHFYDHVQLLRLSREILVCERKRRIFIVHALNCCYSLLYCFSFFSTLYLLRLKKLTGEIETPRETSSRQTFMLWLVLFSSSSAAVVACAGEEHKNNIHQKKREIFRDFENTYFMLVLVVFLTCREFFSNLIVYYGLFAASAINLFSSCFFLLFASPPKISLPKCAFLFVQCAIMI